MLTPHSGFHVPVTYLQETSSNQPGRGLQPLSWLFLVLGAGLVLTLPLAWADAWGASGSGSEQVFFNPSPTTTPSPHGKLSPNGSHGGSSHSPGGNGHGLESKSSLQHPLNQATQPFGASAQLANAPTAHEALPLSVKDIKVMPHTATTHTGATSSFEELPLSQLVQNDTNKAAQNKAADTAPNYTQLWSGLILVLLAIVGTLKYLLPWLAKSGAAPALFATAGLPQVDALGKVRQVIPLGAHRQLYVVEVGDRLLVLSSLPNQLQLISEMPLSAMQDKASLPVTAQEVTYSNSEQQPLPPASVASVVVSDVLMPEAAGTLSKEQAATSSVDQQEAIALEVLHLKQATKPSAVRNSVSPSVKAVKPRLQAAHPGHKRWEDERLQGASTALLTENAANDDDLWQQKSKPVWFIPPAEAVVIQLQDYEDDF